MQSNRETTTVILADDHSLILEAVSSQLQQLGGFEILAKVTDGASALSGIESLKPDLAILDNSMPELTGIEVAKALSARRKKRTQLILLTMFGHRHLLAEAKKFGISACVSKEDATSEIENALIAAREGDFFVSPSLEKESSDCLEAEKKSETLTPREKEIVVAIVGGMTTKEIADLLGLSVRTVDHHRERLMRKIDAHNAADVVRYAARMGIRM